ncbi:MAG: proton-conducting transporter membrane subunit [Planctomycetota bacterium]
MSPEGLATLVPVPIITHFVTAVICIILWGRTSAQRWLSVVGTIVALMTSSVLLIGHASGDVITPVYVGGWAAPFGITLVVDLFSAIMLVLNGLVGLACVIYGFGNIDNRREQFGYHVLVQAMLGACAQAFVAGDLFNMYVAFEVMLISSFVLLTLGGTRGQLEGAIKYVALNLVSSTIFLIAVGLLYGMIGTLNIADMGERLTAAENPRAVSVIAVLFVVAYGIKAGTFPLFFWLPASYHTPPSAVSALFSGLLTKVGAYAMIRVFSAVFVADRAFTGEIMIWMAGATMLVGALAAAVQGEMRRALSFQLVSSIGYIVMGLGVALVAWDKADDPTLSGEASAALRAAGTLSIAGAVVYIAHHMIVKTNLFFFAGLVRRIFGHGEIARLGGLYKSHPMLALGFLLSALSLAGLPIFSGFWAKLALVRAGLEAGGYWIVGVALLTGIVTLYTMGRLWCEVFWKDAPEDASDRTKLSKVSAGAEPPPRTDGRWGAALMGGPAIAMTALTIYIGLAPAGLFGVAEKAGAQLADRSQYVSAVLPEAYLAELRADIVRVIAAREAENAGEIDGGSALADVPTDREVNE